jgi:hypothetical protein
MAVSLRMTGSPVASFAAVPMAFCMSTPLRCAVIRWPSLLLASVSLTKTLSSAFQPTSPGVLALYLCGSDPA